MKHEPSALWQNFRSAFADEIRGASDATLHLAWKTPSNRTGLYGVEIIPRVATRLGFTLEPELLRVDWAMLERSSSHENIPLIFVESENAAATAGREMRKLCAVSCPVAALITVVEWNPEVFPKSRWRHELMAEWERIIKAQYEVWPREGIIGIIVGEWGPNNVLRFYSLAYSTTADILRREEQLMERAIAIPDALTAA